MAADLAQVTIRLTLTGSDASVGEEGYRLCVAESRITVAANHPAGLFYGVQTLRQLMFRVDQRYGVAVRIPCIEIREAPRFSWRGMHLDVSRHFYDKAFIKRYIDHLAELKLNVFHWHLTDDQGWRLAVRKHPRLVEVAAWRTDRGLRYGGFYTRQDVREIVEYARQRYVTVVPEIEMPGHAQAVLAANPQLACVPKAYEVWSGYGISEDAFCARNEATFAFLEDVLDEVIDLFPSRYIHVGGDECLKTRWESCPKCQHRIADEGLADEHELQGYFMRRITRFLAERGRTAIGWDEIMEGGLAPGVAVMSWRGTHAGQEAARLGHPVVMTPKISTYFNYKHRKGDAGPGHPQATPLENVYALNPAEGLTPAESANVLGTQGCLWTEYVTTPAEAGFMLLPRLHALAEVAWTSQRLRVFAEFQTRLHALWPDAHTSKGLRRSHDLRPATTVPALT